MVLFIYCPCSLMDKTTVFGTVDVGSIPARGTRVKRSGSLAGIEQEWGRENILFSSGGRQGVRLLTNDRRKTVGFRGVRFPPWAHGKK